MKDRKEIGNNGGYCSLLYRRQVICFSLDPSCFGLTFRYPSEPFDFWSLTGANMRHRLVTQRLIQVKATRDEQQGQHQHHRQQEPQQIE